MIQVIKKDNTLEPFNRNKIINACKKASMRALDNLKYEDYKLICDKVEEYIKENYQEQDDYKITVKEIHSIVENVLMELYPKSGTAYRQYRNYKLIL